MGLSTSDHARRRGGGVKLFLGAGLAALVAGCGGVAEVTPFSAGPVDSRSNVASDVAEAAKSPGGYPHFATIPPVPTDVRSIPAWRVAVLDELAARRALESEAGAIPFTLANTEAWAHAEHAKIPPAETQDVSADEASESETYAAAQRARATPPPAPH